MIFGSKKKASPFSGQTEPETVRTATQQPAAQQTAQTMQQSAAQQTPQTLQQAATQQTSQPIQQPAAQQTAQVLQQKAARQTAQTLQQPAAQQAPQALQQAAQRQPAQTPAGNSPGIAGLTALIDNIENIIIGKRSVIELIVTALLAGGHVLIEDIPGVGKTQLVSSLAHSCGGAFNRLQLTPDVMPSDITGFSMPNPATKTLEFRKGAAFCNFLLADEINRASPKSQSALLEAMEEEQVSIDGTTYKLPDPFMVLATQNPVETYGTYHLPEAQMDRFLMRLTMGYPGRAHELDILKRSVDAQPENLVRVLEIDQLVALRRQAEAVFSHDKVDAYILDLVEATRTTEGILLGVSPRGSLALQHAARAYALLKGRSYVLPDDVKYLAPHVLSHRILLTPQGRSRWGAPEKAIDELLGRIPVPVA